MRSTQRRKGRCSGASALSFRLHFKYSYDRIRQLCDMGGHRTRKVRTLAPGPEGTEKTQDDEEKRDRKIRRMRFRTS